VGKHQPLRCFAQKIVRNDTRFIATWLEPWHRNPNIIWRIAACPFGQLFNNRDNRVAGIEDIIDDEYAIVVADLLDDVVEAMYSDRTALINAHIGRSPDSDVVRLDAAIGENLLHGHSHRCTTSPNGDDHCGLESAFQNIKS